MGVAVVSAVDGAVNDTIPIVTVVGGMLAVVLLPRHFNHSYYIHLHHIHVALQCHTQMLQGHAQQVTPSILSRFESVETNELY